MSERMTGRARPGGGAMGGNTAGGSAAGIGMAGAGAAGRAQAGGGSTGGGATGRAQAGGGSTGGGPARAGFMRGGMMRGGPMGGGPMAGGAEKPKNFKETWLRLIGYSKKHMPAAAVALVLAAVGTVLQIVGPDRLKDMANEIMKGLPALAGGVPVSGAIDLRAVADIGFFLVAFYAGSAILSFTQNYIMATVTQAICRNMRADISRKINRLPLKYFDRTSHGDVQSRVTNDVDAIGQTMSQSIGNLVTSATLFVGSGLMMFRNSWILALVAIGASVLGFAAMLVIMGRSQKYFKRQQDGLGEANGLVEETYSGHNVVKAYNGGKEAKRRFEEVNQGLYDSGWKSQFISGLMMPLMTFVGNFGYVAVCVAGAALAVGGSISFGVIVAFMLYIRLFTQPLSQIAQSFQNMQRTAAAGERVFEFFDEEEMQDESGKPGRLENAKGDVEFRHARFGYSPGKTVIHDFSARVRPGQKVAIVGPTGAGKTTIVNLLMRFYELDGGEILLDGVPISSVPRESVHGQFGMVLQDTWLFEGTIRENIAYCKQGVTDRQVEDACRAVGLHHFIRTLPQGYDTPLTEKASLSQGQKQLATIARAMVQNANMMILDEATSSVDTRTEVLIQAAMDKLTEGRTSFVIAHRLSTIKNADTILVMRDGDIVESGSHAELLAKGGFYAELYNSQFEPAA